MYEIDTDVLCAIRKPFLEKIKQLETENESLKMSIEKQKEINKDYVDEVYELQKKIKDLEYSLEVENDR